jgi:adenosine deaminase
MTEISDEMLNFIKGLPKAELHVHLESTMRPETNLKLAAKNRIDYPFKTVDDIKEALDNRTFGLESFLDTHYKIFSVIKTKTDFCEATYEFLRICNENNVVYVEIMFDPQFHTEQGIKFEDIILGINKGRESGFRDFGVEANLIMCINRERTVESAWELIDQAYPYKHLITGLGLDSYEKDNPPRKYIEVYDVAREQGYKVTAHCDVDQENSVKHIWECIDLLKTNRIDHGVNCIEDSELVKELIKRDITFTVCPTWRNPYSGPRYLVRLKKMYDMGLKVTLNTDDPAEFNSGYMNQMLVSVVGKSDFTKRDLVHFMRNAFDGSWLPQDSKNKYIKELNRYASSITRTQID